MCRKHYVKELFSPLVQASKSQNIENYRISIVTNDMETWCINAQLFEFRLTND